MKLDPRDILDATTRRTLADSAALDRRVLLDAIELQRRRRSAGDHDDASHASDVAASVHGAHVPIDGAQRKALMER